MVGGVVVADNFRSAQADTGANTYTSVTVTETADGSGQGTASACFVNSKNGYSVGDNTATDGVVCSGDTVTYSTQVAFATGPARTVLIGLNIPQYLSWPASAQGVFCQSGKYVTATLQTDASGNPTGCSYTVPAGVSETLGNPLVLTGADTASQAQSGQVVSMTTTLTKQGSTAVANPVIYNESDAAAVTVVSAPADDVVLSAYPQFRWPQTWWPQCVNDTCNGVQSSWSDSATSDTFYAVPVGLTAAGYSPTKGATTLAPWSGSIDVSSVKSLGATFTITYTDKTGATVTNSYPAGTTSLPVTNAVGQVKVTINYPNGYDPKQQNGSSESYDFRVNVSPGSFSTGGLLNNGNGSQPGDDQPKSSSTYNAGTGAVAGSTNPNNDWYTINVYKPTPVQGILGKQIYGPYNSSYTIWDSPNIIEQGSQVNYYRGQTCFGSSQIIPCNSVAQSTQLTDHAYILSSNIYNPNNTEPGQNTGDSVQLTAAQLANISGQIVIGDMWDKSKEAFDVSRLADLKLVGPSGQVIDPSNYVLQYTTTVWPNIGTEGSAGWSAANADLMSSGATDWVTGTPTAAATGIRVVVTETKGNHIIPLDIEPGAGLFTVNIPLTILSALGPDGTEVPDFGSSTMWNIKSNDSNISLGNYAGSMGDEVILKLPATPTSAIAKGVISTTHVTNGSSKTTWNTADGKVWDRDTNPWINQNLSVSSGDQVTFAITPTVKQMTNSNPVTATLTDKLDPCQLNPTLAAGSPWTMTVTKAATGTCGSSTATGAVLTFTLKNTVPSFTDIYGDGTLPSIVYTTTSSVITPNTAQVVDYADLNVTGVPKDSTAQAVYTALTSFDMAQDIEETLPQTKASATGGTKTVGLAEINKPLTWNVETYSYAKNATTNSGGGPIDSIIILPQSGGASCSGGDSYVEGVSSAPYSKTGYTGPACSSFKGTYTLTSAAFDASNTASGFQLYCTTQASPTFDPSKDTWVAYSASACKNATALRVTRAAAATVSAASLNISLTPSGNATGDQYLMWLDGNANLVNSTTNPVPASAWPAENDVVSSSLSGTVWWDTNQSGTIDPADSSKGTTAEAGIGGVKVCLYTPAASSSTSGAVLLSDGETYGVPFVAPNTSAQACQTTTTTGSGAVGSSTGIGWYQFTNINSGTYIVDEPHSASNNNGFPASVTTYYGQSLPVTETYSYNGKMGSLVSLDATAAVPFDSTVPKVDFGWVKPNPNIQLDKQLLSSSCATGGTCTAQWEIDVTNNGNQPVTPTLTDTLSQKPLTESVQKGSSTTAKLKSFRQSNGTTVALDINGNIWAWGNNSSGQIGNGSTNNSKYVMVTGGSQSANPAITATFTSVYTGNNVTVALDSAGNVWSWGDNTYGTVGNNVTSRVQTTPLQVTGAGSVNASATSGIKFTSVQTNGQQTIALDSNGNIWVWGRSNNAFPTELTKDDSGTTLPKFKVVQAGILNGNVGNTPTLAALDVNGHLWVWSTYTGRTAPHDVTPANTTFTSFDVNANAYYIALDSSGNAWINGGEVTSTSTGAATPVFTAVSQDHSGSTVQYFALDKSGNIWTFNSGKAVNVTPSGKAFTSITGETQTRQFIDDTVSPGYTAAAIATDGTLWMWGANGSGQVGTGGSATSVTAPTNVTPSGTVFKSVETYSGITEALDSNGNIWFWGQSTSGESGNGGTSNLSVPTELVVAQVSTGPFVSVTPGSKNDVSVPLVTLNSGDKASVLVNATYLQSTSQQVVANQAYVDASNTPIAGLLKKNGYSQSIPTAPIAPTVANYNPLGVTGNKTCNTNVDTPLDSDGSVDKATGYTTSQSSSKPTEDSCDQVPALFPAAATTPQVGNLTGQTWYDANKDGVETAPGSGNTGEYMVGGLTATLTQTAIGGSATPISPTAKTSLDTVTVPSSVTSTCSTYVDSYYTVNPKVSGTYTFYVSGVAAGSVQVYDSSGNYLNGVSLPQPVSYSMTAGTTYVIDVYPYSSGACGLNVSSSVSGAGLQTPGSVTWSQATAAGVTPVTKLVAAPTFSSSTTVTQSTAGQTLYYAINPTVSGIYQIYTTGSLNTSLALYSSTGTSNASALQTGSNGSFLGSGTNQTLSYNLTAGQTYIIGVSATSTSSFGLGVASSASGAGLGTPTTSGLYLQTAPTALPSTQAPLVLTTTTSTGSDGKLDCSGKQLGIGQYAFCNLPIGSYTVQFGIPATGVSPAAPAGSYAYTTQTASQVVATVPPSNKNSSGQTLSLPPVTTGLTAAQQVLAASTTTNVNAGLISVASAVQLVKNSKTYSDTSSGAPDLGTVSPVTPKTLAVLPNSGGKSPAVTDLQFVFKNTGQDPLGSLAFTDVTTTGAVVSWKSCTTTAGSVTFTKDVAGNQVAGNFSGTLAVGSTVTCTGTLPAMPVASSHQDTVTITGKGTQSNTNVTATDYYVATVPLKLDLEKLVLTKAGQWGPLAGSNWQISTSATGGAAAGITVTKLTTVTAGNAWSVSGAQPNTPYWLTETTAPKGYSLLAEPVGFLINPSDGSVSLLSGQGVLPDGVVVTTQIGTGGTVGDVAALDGVPVISVRDTPVNGGFALPFTGSSGVVAWVIAGLSLGLLCLLGLCELRRRVALQAAAGLSVPSWARPVNGAGLRRAELAGLGVALGRVRALGSRLGLGLRVAASRARVVRIARLTRVASLWRWPHGIRRWWGRWRT